MVNYSVESILSVTNSFRHRKDSIIIFNFVFNLFQLVSDIENFEEGQQVSQQDMAE
jgi:hypothetical protein